MESMTFGQATQHYSNALPYCFATLTTQIEFDAAFDVDLE